MSKETPWFPGWFEPVRVGLYQRKLDPDKGVWFWAWWSGKHWCCGALLLEEALQLKWEKSGFQALPWRGLTKD